MAARWWWPRRAAHGCASTPIQTSKRNTQSDTRRFLARNETPPPISGWMQAKGVVVEEHAQRRQILMGAAANQEALAIDPRGPVNAAQSARLLYRTTCRDVSQLPLAPEAAWRAADILWQIQKADASARCPPPRSATLTCATRWTRTGLRKSSKFIRTPASPTLRHIELIDNKLCGDWQGQTKCPEKEAEYLRKVCDRTSRRAAYGASPLSGRLPASGARLICMPRKATIRNSGSAKAHAHDFSARLKDKFPQSDYTWRACGARVQIG